MRRDWLDWRPDWNSWRIAETTVISLVALGLAWWANPDDPLSLRSGVPWVWFAPVLLALRYGMLAGVLSATLQLIIWLALEPADTLLGGIPQQSLFGGLILTMLCGEFSGLWRDRLRRQTELNHYLDQRMEELTRQHYLLKLSHDRLEQNLISRPFTLRGALAELRTLPMPANDTDPLPNALAFMRLITAHCQISVAALYPATAHRIQSSAIAKIGEPGALATDDPLVVHALAKRALAYVNQLDGADEAASRYLIAVPVYRADVLAGLLTVERMPFFAFHHDTLQTLAALLAYYGDLLDLGEPLPGHPDCPLEFSLHLVRLARVQDASGIGSHLVQLRFPADSRGRALRDRLARSKRELDFYWLHDTPAPTLIALLPITDTDGARGFLTRIDAWLQANAGADAEALGIGTSSTLLDPKNPRAQLEGMLNAAA